MLSLFNPYEQFSIYPRDDYGDHGGLLSHEVAHAPLEGGNAEETARRNHPSAQPVDEAKKRRSEFREQLAS